MEFDWSRQVLVLAQRRQALPDLPHLLGHAGHADGVRHVPLLPADAGHQRQGHGPLDLLHRRLRDPRLRRRCPPTRPATAACGCRSRTRPDLQLDRHRRPDLPATSRGRPANAPPGRLSGRGPAKVDLWATNFRQPAAPGSRKHRPSVDAVSGATGAASAAGGRRGRSAMVPPRQAPSRNLPDRTPARRGGDRLGASGPAPAATGATPGSLPRGCWSFAPERAPRWASPERPARAWPCSERPRARRARAGLDRHGRRLDRRSHRRGRRRRRHRHAGHNLSRNGSGDAAGAAPPPRHRRHWPRRLPPPRAPAGSVAPPERLRSAPPGRRGASRRGGRARAARACPAPASARGTRSGPAPGRSTRVSKCTCGPVQLPVQPT